MNLDLRMLRGESGTVSQSCAVAERDDARVLPAIGVVVCFAVRQSTRGQARTALDPVSIRTGAARSCEARLHAGRRVLARRADLRQHRRDEHGARSRSLAAWSSGSRRGADDVGACQH